VCFAIYFSFLMMLYRVVKVYGPPRPISHRNDGAFIPNHTGSGFFFCALGKAVPTGTD
jgi:hypothetical protein